MEVERPTAQLLALIKELRTVDTNGMTTAAAVDWLDKIAFTCGQADVLGDLATLYMPELTDARSKFKQMVLGLAYEDDRTLCRHKFE